MVRLKLMRLPHGPNRNRTLRRAAELSADELSLVAVAPLFRRFWQLWRQGAMGRRDTAAERGGSK